MCALRILQHFTKIYYHNLPSEYDFSEEVRKLGSIQLQAREETGRDTSAELLPKRDAINELMAQLAFSEFPELVEQILVENFLQNRGDITNGAGDESRDIHTITATGKRHLTQCRHTQTPQKPNLDRHDLDELWAATARLQYDEGLLVTNSDMTSPAKASYLNGDYEREGYPKLTVWNGRDLWAQISNNQNILNRWFGGLAQLHTVKRFSFKALPVEMPERKPLDIDKHLKALINIIEKSGYEIEQNGLVWKLEDDNKIVFMRIWFTSISSMFMPCSLSAPHDLLTAPIHILEFHVVIKGQSVSPESVRKGLVALMLDSWKKDEAEKWISILTSTLLAPVYIHDTQNVVFTPLLGYNSYILMHEKCIDEAYATTRPGDGFSRTDPDELYFVNDGKGIEFSVNYCQPISEIRHDTVKAILYQADKTLQNSAVFSVKYNNRFEFSMALASTNMTTLVLEDDSKKKLFFCFELDEDRKKIIKSELKEFVRSLKLQNIQWKPLNEKEKKRIRKRLPREVSIEQPDEHCPNNDSELYYPIDFTSRNILCMKTLNVPQPYPDRENLAFELLKYKLMEQHKEGYDEGFPEGTNVISYRQMKNLLFRPSQITGRQCVNINIANYPNSLDIFLIFRPQKFESLAYSLNHATELMDIHVKEILKLIDSCPRSS